ncbi:MAG: 2-phosphosulfolactate phosphatase [Chthoniobacter sp.]|nr:2-phosphosulfolactate phosphatase [Chthoniobacter sp.]
MHIDVVLHPAEIVSVLPTLDLSGTVCVVFDVLRATSSMITGLAHGATEIYPVRTIDEALALKVRMPTAVLGGERQGDLIPGFEVGNSPAEYDERVRGRQIITTTTNGTIALRACDRAERVLVGAVLNIAALAEVLQQTWPRRVLIVCAGTFDTFALEDACGAGLLIGYLGAESLGDAAHAALAVSRLYADPRAALRASHNGRVLAAAGRASDVDCCGQLSRYHVVGEMRAGVIRALTP